ncbi:Zinc cluster transcription factor 15 [Pleurotus pulmonarius]
MTSDSNQGSPSSSSSTRPASKPLKRGRACISCRFLKIKCDGAKPICGPCMRHPKDDGCEYSDAQGRSRTKVLEETIQSLQARLDELQNPQDSTPSVTLHDPYRPYNESRLGASQSFAESSRAAEASMEASLLSPLSTFDSPLASQGSPNNAPYLMPTASSPISGSSGRSSSVSSPYQNTTTFLGHEEPPLPVIQTLLDSFLPYASELGFFLHPARFRADALRALPFGQTPRPTMGLLSAVYLWGAQFSQQDPSISYEGTFLSRALQNTATDLTREHPNRVLHTIQAEVLLAYYFWRNGKILEAKTHAGGAVSLAIGCGLHRWRSARPPPIPGIGVVVENTSNVMSPRDSVEEGEIINGFWAVLTLHNSLSATVDPAGALSCALEVPGISVDTPWPMDMEGYRAGLLTQDLRGSLTIRNFLSGTEYPVQGKMSNAEMIAKAVTLFHHASFLSGQASGDMSARDAQIFHSTFQSLDSLIKSFRASLPPLDSYGSESRPRSLMLVHAVTNAAIIKLHNVFAYTNANSNEECMSAARSIVNNAQQDLGFVNPLMGHVKSLSTRFLNDAQYTASSKAKRAYGRGLERGYQQ